MPNLLYRFLLFLLPLVGYVLAVSWSNQTIECAPFETASNLVLVPRDTEFDMVVLGTSQTRLDRNYGSICTEFFPLIGEINGLGSIPACPCI